MTVTVLMAVDIVTVLLMMGELVVSCCERRGGKYDVAGVTVWLRKEEQSAEACLVVYAEASKYNVRT